MLTHFSTRLHPRILGGAASAALLLAFSGPGAQSLDADTIISVQFECSSCGGATNYSGVEPDAASADPQFGSSNVWNHLTATFSQTGSVSFPLVNNSGTATTAALGISHIDGAYNAASNFPDTYFYSYSNSSFTITGLTPNEPFTLFLYAYDQRHFRDETFTVGSSSFDTANATASCITYGPPCRNSEDPIYVSDASITGDTSATGTISGTWDLDSSNVPPFEGEIDWSGFQLDIVSPAVTSTPEPAAWGLLAIGLIALLARRFATRGFANEK